MSLLRVIDPELIKELNNYQNMRRDTEYVKLSIYHSINSIMAERVYLDFIDGLAFEKEFSGEVSSEEDAIFIMSTFLMLLEVEIHNCYTHVPDFYNIDTTGNAFSDDCKVNMDTLISMMFLNKECLTELYKNTLELTIRLLGNEGKEICEKSIRRLIMLALDSKGFIDEYVNAYVESVENIIYLTGEDINMLEFTGMTREIQEELVVLEDKHLSQKVITHRDIQLYQEKSYKLYSLCKENRGDKGEKVEFEIDGRTSVKDRLKYLENKMNGTNETEKGINTDEILAINPSIEIHDREKFIKEYSTLEEVKGNIQSMMIDLGLEFNNETYGIPYLQEIDCNTNVVRENGDIKEIVIAFQENSLALCREVHQEVQMVDEPEDFIKVELNNSLFEGALEGKLLVTRFDKSKPVIKLKRDEFIKAIVISTEVLDLTEELQSGIYTKEMMDIFLDHLLVRSKNEGLSTKRVSVIVHTKHDNKKNSGRRISSRYIITSDSKHLTEFNDIEIKRIFNTSETRFVRNMLDYKRIKK